VKGPAWFVCHPGISEPNAMDKDKSAGLILMRWQAGNTSLADRAYKLQWRVVDGMDAVGLEGKAVLATTDLSARSDRAVDRASQLAEEWEVPLKLVHVIEAGSRFVSRPDGAKAAVRTVLPDPTAKVEILLPTGTAPHAICEAAQQSACGLIVTGVARNDHLGDSIMGTTVDHVIRHATPPVLVVKRRPHDPYRSIIVATDFSDYSMAALQTACSLFPDAIIRLITAYHVPFEGWLDFEGSREEMRDFVQKQMDAFIDKSEIPDTVRERLLPDLSYGSASTAIADAVDRFETDLLIMGTHGRGAAARALIGSTASYLLRSVPVDTLMVRKA